MKRIEIIANRSVEEDLFASFAKADIVKNYTKFPIVHGVGKSGPRMGDSIWPEENFALVIWCDEDEAKKIEEAVMAVKARFSKEGIKIFY